MRLLIAAGGTGGHLFPGIAVGEFLRKADSKGEVRFIGSERGMEETILKEAGFERQSLAVGRLKGEGWRERMRTFLRLPRSLIRARRLLVAWPPDAVLGIGGYSSGPVILAACLKRIPRAILEPNSIPGLTNRLLARFTNRIFISFSETASFFPRGKVLVTGTPVRQSLTAIGQRRGKIPPGPPLTKGGRGDFRILVFGGSQGATALNRAFVDLLPRLEESGRPFWIHHQTGENDFESVREAYAKSRIPHRVSPFIHEMDEAYEEADLVVARAGASTVAEIIETASPSILVPYPFAADDHQRFNALSLVTVGGASLILNRELGECLGERILFFEAHREELRRMSERLVDLRKVPAAEAVAKECLHLSNA